jgi:tRNA-splicing ligase RtcB
VRVWARTLDEDTAEQLRRLASQPWVVGHVAAMADAHVSEGVAVGSVFATEHTVVPAALGGDLGCGMCAIRVGADARRLGRAQLERLVARLGDVIPAGDAVHRGPGVAVPDALHDAPLSSHALERTREALLRKHLATLGGGNHFVELDRDADGELWLLVHSGSRGLGAAVATHHRKAARARDSGGAPGSLFGLDVREDAGRAYLADLGWALDVARANRQALAAAALDVVAEVLGGDVGPTLESDVHHNFVAREVWSERDLLVHRKGAIAAPRGARALVPGSMGTASYLVEGLGNEATFGSCSHGAGRVLRRRDARARISPRALAESMRRVVYPVHLARSLVEESPSAYRDITSVLDAQVDLVKRLVRLEPIAVLKG